MKKIDSLQGLRAVAFGCIFLGHCGIGGGGSMGVSIFLVLSGFLMTYNYFNRKLDVGLKKNFLFAIKKIKKLYPLHLIMLLLVAFVKMLTGGVKVFELLANIFLIQAWIPLRTYYFSFNGVAWYLSVCILLYFAFPCFLKVMKSKFKVYTSIVTAAIIYAVQVTLGMFVSSKVGSTLVYNNLWFTYIFPMFRLGDFFIGCCFGHVFVNCFHRNISVFKSTVIEVIAFVFMAITHMIRLYSSLPECILESVIYIPASVMVIYSVALKKGFVSKVLSSTFFVEIGNISAYAFLIHQVIINAMQSIGVNGIVIIGGSFLITIVLAYGYRFVLEKWNL